jgi:predicted phage terminase large subunit-like protein
LGGVVDAIDSAVEEDRSLDFEEYIHRAYPEYQFYSYNLQLIEQLERVAEGDINRLMIFMPPRHGKPVWVGARVLLSDGTYTRLGDIEVGDEVITHKGRSKTVTAVHEQGQQPSLKITTNAGRETTAATDHPFLTPSGWVKAENLSEGQPLGAVNPQFGHRSERPFEEFRLAGYFVGDGCTAPSGESSCSASIACFDDVQKSDLLHCADIMGFDVNEGAKEGKFLFSDGVRPWLRDVDLARKTSHDKRVPEFVFRGSDEQIAHFVGAYLSTDGCVSKRQSSGNPKLEWFSVNRDLLTDVQSLLLRLGIQSSLYKKTSCTNYTDGEHVSWRLVVQNEDHVSRCQSKIPVFGEKADFLEDHKVQQKTFDHVLNADRIKSIESVGKKECRCLTVEDDHSFLADDLAVHNSLTASQLFTGYYLHQNPRHKVALASYGARLAENHSRQSQHYFKKAGGDLSPNKQKQGEWDTLEGGGLFATGIGGALTGKGMHLGIIDDPVKNAEEAYSRTQREKVKDWYRSTFLSRQESMNSGIIIIQTRWHKDDLAGWLLSREDKVQEGWTIINLPAIAERQRDFPDTCEVVEDFRQNGQPLCPEMYDREWFEKEKKNVGERVFASLYQQRPTREEGGIWQPDWFQSFVNEDFETRDRGFHWDLAYTERQSNSASAYVDAAKGPQGNIYVFDCGFEWMEFPRLIQKMKTLGGPHYIEDKASGKSAKQTLRQSGVPAYEVGVKGDKIARSKLVTPLAERGEVFVHERCRDELLSDPRQGILNFPNGTHDDLADAFSQALNYLSDIHEDQQKQTVGGFAHDEAGNPIWF